MSIDLKKGGYMRVSDVYDFLMHKECKTTLSDIVGVICPVYGGEYYSTSDLRSIIAEKLYRKMETIVSTLIKQ